jgi:hypothetical protein
MNTRIAMSEYRVLFDTIGISRKAAKAQSSF